ncbi:MAG: hypothetical protein HFJ07_04805 [Lachnospiraceae bacterium]|jgi:uncharacterized membrane protein|nr:hypothetical protein [Lachnospiraceae bacterium]
MKERIWHCLCQTLNALIIAGIIILLIGLYYLIIKAGIPYQDPPLDLQLQYAVNTRIGSILTGIGFKMVILGGIFRFTLQFIGKNSQTK